MSTESSFNGYSLFDLFTRIIPGLVVVLPAILAILILEGDPQFGFSWSIIIVALVGLLIGEIIDLFRSALFSVPSPFKQVLYHYTEDERILRWSDRLDLWVKERLPQTLRSRLQAESLKRRTVFESAGKDFRVQFENQFNLDFESNSSYLLYATFYSYMESKMSQRTRRYRVLRIFAQNLIAAIVLVGLATVWVALQNLEDPTTLVVSLVTIMILFVVFEVALIFTSAAYPFVDLLIIDYYVDSIKD